mmetsp:Transcript_6147/g.13484  ORF Transcript_6147/g.13484 Transcript_6147/m.13484 type:complete len:239 (+) Transcript_6147:157-873(+)
MSRIATASSEDVGVRCSLESWNGSFMEIMLVVLVHLLVLVLVLVLVDGIRKVMTLVVVVVGNNTGIMAMVPKTTMDIVVGTATMIKDTREMMKMTTEETILSIMEGNLMEVKITVPRERRATMPAASGTLLLLLGKAITAIAIPWILAISETIVLLVEGRTATDRRSSKATSTIPMDCTRKKKATRTTAKEETTGGITAIPVWGRGGVAVPMHSSMERRKPKHPTLRPPTTTADRMMG